MSDFLENLIKKLENQLSEKSAVEFSTEDIEKLSILETNAIIKHFRGQIMMKLPDSEIIFFEWLKENDQKVWYDLWGEDTDELLYVVSIGFLKHLLPNGSGFPICDLVSIDNFWLAKDHILEGGLTMLQTAIERNEELSLDEQLLYDAYNFGIDIWHFAYKHNIDIEKAKDIVRKLAEKQLILHLKNREEIADSVEF